MDLTLAPVAVEIDMNLQRLRGKPHDELMATLQLELDTSVSGDDRHLRAADVLAQATRGVDLHGWTAVLTDDASAIRISGGSVTLDIAVGANVLAFVEGG